MDVIVLGAGVLVLEGARRAGWSGANSYGARARAHRARSGIRPRRRADHGGVGPPGAVEWWRYRWVCSNGRRALRRAARDLARAVDVEPLLSPAGSGLVHGQREPGRELRLGEQGVDHALHRDRIVLARDVAHDPVPIVDDDERVRAGSVVHGFER